MLSLLFEAASEKSRPGLWESEKNHEHNDSEKQNQALPILFFIKQRKGRESSMYSAFQVLCTRIPSGWAETSLCKYWQSLHLSKSSQSLILSARFVYSLIKVRQLGEEQAWVWLVSLPDISTLYHRAPTHDKAASFLLSEPSLPRQFSSYMDVLVSHMNQMI